MEETLAKRKRRRERDPEEIVCGPYNPGAAPMTRDRRQRESTRKESMDSQTERGRQVASVLEKPEHRRNRTRYLPEVTGITSLSRTDVKTDMRDMDRATQAMAPEELDVEEEEEDEFPLLMSVIRPPPAVPDEGEARRKRYRQWHRRADDTFFDASRYQRTIQLIRRELRRLENERLETEDKCMLLRTHFVNHLQLLKKEREDLGKEIEKLERCCETEADLASTRRKHRVHAFREVLTKLKHQGKRVVSLQEQQQRLKEKLRQLEAMSEPQVEGKSEEGQEGEEEEEAAVYESEDVGRMAQTPMGRGTVEQERMDGVYVIKLPYGTAYMGREQVVLEDEDGQVPEPFVTDAELIGRWVALADSFSLLEGHEAMEQGLFRDEDEAFAEVVTDPGADKDDKNQEEVSTLKQLIPGASTLLPSEDPSLLLFGSSKSLLQLEYEGMQFLENVLPEDMEMWEEDKEEVEEIDVRVKELEEQYQAGNVERENLFKKFVERQEANLKLGRELFELRAEMGELKKAQKQRLLKSGYPGGKPTPQMRAAVQHQLAASGLLGPRYLQQAQAAAKAAENAASDQTKAGGAGGNVGVNGGDNEEAANTTEDNGKPAPKRAAARKAAANRAANASSPAQPESTTSSPPAQSTPAAPKTRKSSGSAAR